MTLSTLDWSFVFIFFTISLGIGFWVSKKSGSNTNEYFLSGRNMPWWLLGMSMVATTFSTDTPNLVTDIVRQNGVAGNWVWWAFLITGMLTVFVYARLWRKSQVLTDIEFYELRYSGQAARFLRGFRAVYLGLIFNVLAMAAVCLAAIKMGEVMLGLGKFETIGIAAIITMLFSSLGGFRGVVYTDFLLFFVAIIGAIGSAVVAVNLEPVGGLEMLVDNPNIQDKLAIIPDFSNLDLVIPIFIIPLAVQWWSSWYPGGEPGGGGYVAQRMLAAKDENHAIQATFFFNILHYALRPWPWILVALASMVVFPMSLDNSSQRVLVAEDAASYLVSKTTDEDYNNLVMAVQNGKVAAQENNDQQAVVAHDRMEKILSNNRSSLDVLSLTYLFKERNKRNSDPTQWKDPSDWSDPLAEEHLVALNLAYPKIEINKLGQDLAYPAMLNFLPHGLLGLVVASLIAAFMSTISTHLNWGASYLVHDFYRRFVNEQASEKELVLTGRIITIVLMIFSALIAFVMTNAKQVFDVIIMFGAGTGLLFLLRWFWWRINAWSEIVAMIISGVLSIGFTFFGWFPESLPDWSKFPIIVLLTTIAWVTTMYLTAPVDEQTLRNFYRKIQPGGPGWKKVVDAAAAEDDDIHLEQGAWKIPQGILAMVVGSTLIYSLLFATGNWIYGNTGLALVLTVISGISAFVLVILWKRLGTTIL